MHHFSVQLAEMVALKQTNPGVKVVAIIGGHNCGREQHASTCKKVIICLLYKE